MESSESEDDTLKSNKSSLFLNWRDFFEDKELSNAIRIPEEDIEESQSEDDIND